MKWLAGVCIAAVVLPQIIVGWGAEEAAVGRAIKFLEREVASWRKENGCFSCHNNGDGARALYLAGRKGNKIEAGALRETTAWLSAPGKWHENKGDPGFSDKRLPVIQFGAALAASSATNGKSLRLAAEMIGKEQENDGSWKIEGQRDIGSPAAYGNDLATCMAVLVMEQAGAREKGGVEKARRWFRERKIQTILGAASALLALENDSNAQSVKKKEECREYLLRAQGSSGGWGPYADSPAESFDTAIALIALRNAEGREVERARERGRKFLIEEQEGDGGWPATTRPTGGESYAQRISTTGWALIALLRSGPI